MYQNLERTQSRFESGDAQFERELPPEIRAELFRSRPRSPRMAGNRSHTAAGRVSPPPPLPDVPDAARAPKPSSERGRHPRRENNALGLLLGLLSVLVLIALLVPITTGLHQFGGGTQFPHALPQPPVVEVRRALPAVPRALAVNSLQSEPQGARFVPRADPVSGPLTTTGEPMLSGRQYYVSMPDGRNILVNYKGWVDHACNLPRQPKGGANNAAYTDAATGHTWIWTVPAGTSNVPRWIDP